MTPDAQAAARAILAAAKPDRADHGRTVLVPRHLLERLRTALDSEGPNAAAVDPGMAEAPRNGETP